MDGLALTMSVAAVIVSVYCIYLVRHRQRRLTAMERRLDRHGWAIHSLGLKAPKQSSPSMDTVRESLSVAPEQPDGKNSKGPVLNVVAPRTSTE
jgi:hypothetical protein